MIKYADISFLVLIKYELHKVCQSTCMTFQTHHGPICLKTESVRQRASTTGFLGSISKSGLNSLHLTQNNRKLF